MHVTSLVGNFCIFPYTHCHFERQWIGKMYLWADPIISTSHSQATYFYDTSFHSSLQNSVYLARLSCPPPHTHTHSSLCPQSYLKDFNDLFEELREKKVGIFGICAEAQQELADQAVKDWGLHYQVWHLTFDLSHITTHETDSGWTFAWILCHYVEL